MEQEIRERKVLSEELAKQVNALSVQKKELQSTLKQLREDVAQAEWDADQAVAKARVAADAKIAEIQASVAPFLNVRSQIESGKKQLADLKASMEHDTQRLKHERVMALEALDK